jgi:hypothetical protein
VATLRHFPKSFIHEVKPTTWFDAAESILFSLSFFKPNSARLLRRTAAFIKDEEEENINKL